MFQYVVYDVFTDKAFGGNQLAVFPDARAIPEDKLQSITAEFNFSEVTFVYPPEDPAHTARVRIFTPTSEVDFAGHPTIGTLIALYDRGQTSPMVLELGIGPLSCTVSEAGAVFTTSQPLQLSSNPAVTLVADVLGVSRDAIKTATHAPVVGSLGIPFVLARTKGIPKLPTTGAWVAVFIASRDTPRTSATNVTAGFEDNCSGCDVVNTAPASDTVQDNGPIPSSNTMGDVCPLS